MKKIKAFILASANATTLPTGAAVAGDAYPE